MEIIYFVKRVNNTELGKGRTHDTYLLVPTDMCVSDLFPKDSEYYIFKDSLNGEDIEIKLTRNRNGETRIVGLGQYYRSHHVDAGDEVVVGLKTTEKNINRFIDIRHKKQSLILQKKLDFFEVLTPEKLGLLISIDNAFINGNQRKVTLKYVMDAKKRADSPSSTKLYDLLIDNKSIVKNYKNNAMIEVVCMDDFAVISNFKSCYKVITKLEE